MNQFAVITNRVGQGPEGGGGGGGTLIFSYICRRGSFYGVQHIIFQYFWEFSEKLIFFLSFLGYEDFVDIFWGSSQNWTIFRGHFYAV